METTIEIDTMPKPTESEPVQGTVQTTSEVLVGLIKSVEQSLKDIKINMSKICLLKKEVQMLEKSYKKTENKKKKVRGEGKQNGGFIRPVLISDQLSELLGVEKGVPIARSSVAKLLSTYAETNNLKNPQDRRILMFDSEAGKKLAGVFSEYEPERDPKVTLITIQKYIKHHFSNIVPTEPVVEKAVAEEKTVDIPKVEVRVEDIPAVPEPLVESGDVQSATKKTVMIKKKILKKRTEIEV